MNRLFLLFATFAILVGASPAAEDETNATQDSFVLFQIGRPDARSDEFRYVDFDKAIAENRNPAISFVVGQNRDSDWSTMHLSSRDFKNAGRTFTHRVEFDAERDYPENVYLIIGVCFSHATEPSLLTAELNGERAPTTRAPVSTPEAFAKNFNGNKDTGTYQAAVLPFAGGTVRKGRNVLEITLSDGSWIFYDYLRLSTSPTVPEKLGPVDLLTRFKADEFQKQGVREILFAVRKPGTDPHWYANFGYYAWDENTFPFPLGTGAKLCVLNIETKEVRTILETKTGSIRDPQIHYDGKKCVFSYFPDGARHFNLYEINLDGTDLRRLTFGDWDDVEPSYLPNGDLVFCSTRCKRWVQCWLTQVATIHRCGPNGENIRELSSNVEQDNAPWPLPNGQILYTRWEYVDRSQVHYHHLWTMNPDGTRQQVYFGNLHPGRVFIDAKPVPESDRVVVVFSPGHGIKEHYGTLALLSPRGGPDDENSAVFVTRDNDYSYADPWAFSENALMAASRNELVLLDGTGVKQTIYALENDGGDDDFWIAEPRPIIQREREKLVADAFDGPESDAAKRNVGRLLLTNVYEGRQMKDVAPGTVRELLVLETLPEPIHYEGGMDQISVGGTFTLERIVGTVPVAPDGSAYFELPARRSFFFVALDQDGRPVKRMHSFTGVMPGETTTCIGCHESRTDAPPTDYNRRVFAAVNRGASVPTPIADVPDVLDFPRDIQPILDRHCVRCHSYDDPQGGVDLCGDLNVRFSMSYLTLTYRKTFGDNRNRPESNFVPYEIGSSASSLYRLVESEKHYDAKLSDLEKKTLRLWLDTGAVYAGTPAANGRSIFRIYYETGVAADESWPETAAARDSIEKRCATCHNERQKPLPVRLSPGGGAYDVHRIFNLTRPESSYMLKAPLAASAGGWGKCKNADGSPVFADANDPDYRTIFALIDRGRRYYTSENRHFSLGGPIVPTSAYVREMKRFGVLPPDFDDETPLDPYETDQKYWRSLWAPETAESPDADATPRK